MTLQPTQPCDSHSPDDVSCLLYLGHPNAHVGRDSLGRVIAWGGGLYEGLQAAPQPTRRPRSNTMNPPPFNLSPTCQATDNGHRCDLPAGHDYHEAYTEDGSTVSWRNPGPGQYSMPPDVTRATPATTVAPHDPDHAEDVAAQAAALASQLVKIRMACGRIRALLGGDS